jgi:hypothetical protein
MIFPKHFPEDCPPKAAKPVKGEIFRFIRKKVPEDRDFKSHFVLEIKFEPDKLCEACGCSVYLSEEDARAKAEKTPYLKGKKLAKAKLSPEWGRIAQTFDPPHHTWWLVNDKSPTIMFDVIEK